MSRAPDTEQGLFDLGGQVALVTGAAQGLGRAIATALGAHGAAVVLAVPCDVGDPAAVGRLADTAAGWRGRIDTLVCNAGVQGPAGPLAQASDADWDYVFDVNLRGNGAIGLYGTSKAAPAHSSRGRRSSSTAAPSSPTDTNQETP